MGYDDVMLKKGEQSMNNILRVYPSKEIKVAGMLSSVLMENVL